MAQYKREYGDMFINPYNFVSINTKSESRKDIKQQYAISEKLHTGYLECKILVKTPLAIPDSEKKEIEGVLDKKGRKKEHSVYPFYTIDGQKPVIPGSSIRGALRSVYEAVTDSCMVTEKGSMGLTARVNNRKSYLPGLLIRENGEWKLYAAERYLIPIDGYKKFQNYSVGFTIGKQFGKRCIISKGGSHFQNGECVTFNLFHGNQPYKKRNFIIWSGIVSALSQSSKGNAYVYIGEEFSKKHGESLFKKKESKPLNINQEIIRCSMEKLEETIKIYRDSAINRNYGENHSGYGNYEEAKERGVIPIWYDKENWYFSAASIGRMQYKNCLTDLIGSKRPCEKRDSLCKACSLFGMTKGQERVGSRIRVSDAIGWGCSIQRVTLKELGMPRNSYLPFYAEKVKGGQAVPCETYDEAGAGIRGRKFYWHNPKAREDAKVYSTGEKTDRNATMDLVIPGAEFTFKIYYDGITQQQLDELLWTITFWENEEHGVMCHKLGHGKPLGLGSVKMVVTGKVERKVDNSSYKLESSDISFGEVPVQEKNSAVREIMEICNFNALQGKKICYPYVKLSETAKSEMEHIYSGKELNDNVLASHQWFTQNKGTKNNAPEPCTLASILQKRELPACYVSNLEEKDFKPHQKTSNPNLQKETGKVKFFNKEKNKKAP